MTIAEPSFTFGIEEEYHLVDAETCALVPAPRELMAALEGALGEQVSPEFLRSQIEVSTRPCRHISEARSELRHLRATVADLARGYGFAPVAAGTHPLAHPGDVETTDKERYRAIGRHELLPPTAQHWVRTTEKETAHLDKLILTVALSYGGRAEIVDAVKTLMEDVQTGTVQPTRIDETTIQQYLYTHPLQDPDLLIRTSGETRISNFLLWQLAYTELCFTPTLWPDFRRREFLLALIEYQRRERRFGRVLSTVSS